MSLVLATVLVSSAAWALLLAGLVAEGHLSRVVSVVHYHHHLAGLAKLEFCPGQSYRSLALVPVVEALVGSLAAPVSPWSSCKSPRPSRSRCRRLRPGSSTPRHLTLEHRSRHPWQLFANHSKLRLTRPF